VLLRKCEELFDGQLGRWHGQEVKLELQEGAKPYHARAYKIPRCHVQTLKAEVERLVKIGVLKKVNHSEWAAPTFIIPKKDGSVRFISDFRELNKRTLRKPHHVPNIQDMPLNLEGFQWATSLDLNMGHYHVRLDPASKQLCAVVLPFGKYECQAIPMGLCNSPDIFQEKMTELTPCPDCFCKMLQNFHESQFFVRTLVDFQTFVKPLGFKICRPTLHCSTDLETPEKKFECFRPFL